MQKHIKMIGFLLNSNTEDHYVKTHVFNFYDKQDN